MRLLLDCAGTRRWDVWRLAACAVVCLGALACEPSEAPNAEGGKPAGPVVAWIDGEPITVEAVLATRPRGPAGDRAAKVDAAVLEEIACREARRQKLDEQPQVEWQLRQVRREARWREQQILRTALKQQIVGDVEIPEAELQRAYERDQNSFRDRLLQLREWSFDSEQQARSAVAGAGEAGVLDPGEAAEVGPISLNHPPPHYAMAVGELRRPGDRVVIGAGGKWLVVELAEPPVDAKLPFKQVRDRLLRALQKRQADQLFEKRLKKLRSSADVRVDQAVLSDDALWQKPR